MKETQKKETESVYRTGPTALPKGYGGILAVLLVLVILFCGLAGVLGIMNIRLTEYLSLEKKAQAPITFSHTAPQEDESSAVEPTTISTEPARITALGLSVEPVTPFLQKYYHLPQGVYITALEEDCSARAAGCLPGDVILAVNDSPVADSQELLEQLEQIPPRQPVVLTISRGGRTFAVRVARK